MPIHRRLPFYLFTSFIFVLAFILLLFTYQLKRPTLQKRSQATTVNTQPSLEFEPVQLTVYQDVPFTANLIIDTASQPAFGVGARLLYDPSQVTIEQITTTDIFSQFPTVSSDNQVGTAFISGISSSLNQSFTGRAVFATLTITAHMPGTTSINFLFEPGSTTDSNIAVTFGNGDILAQVIPLQLTVVNQTTATATPIPSPSPSSASLNFTVSLQGYSSTTPVSTIRFKYQTPNSNSDLDVRYVPVTRTQGNTYQGVIDNLPVGTYDLLFKGPAHLQRRVSKVILNPGANQLPTLSLTAGDVNNDNRVTSKDLDLVKNNLNKSGTGN